MGRRELMTIEEAVQVLWETRPDRPYKTKGRRLQVAIDTVIDTLKEKEIITNEQAPY